MPSRGLMEDVTIEDEVVTLKREIDDGTCIDDGACGPDWLVPGCVTLRCASWEAASVRFEMHAT